MNDTVGVVQIDGKFLMLTAYVFYQFDLDLGLCHLSQIFEQNKIVNLKAICKYNGGS